jgi:hypothetical protein
MNYAVRLRTLWVVWFLAMLFHVDLGLMPLFHGRSPEIHAHVSEQALPWLFGAMFAYFVVPLVALILIAYADSHVASSQTWRSWRRIHFYLSLVYTVTNVPHLIADVVVPDARIDQILLMAVMVIVGVLINREGWLWWRQSRI